jgi:hypothetical protein
MDKHTNDILNGLIILYPELKIILANIQIKQMNFVTKTKNRNSELQSEIASIRTDLDSIVKEFKKIKYPNQY